MAPQSSAKFFFDAAVAGGAEFLRKLVAEKTPEAEWLDFKSADHLDEAEIKVTWSRALSGFANNEGGVLIWGIDARFDKVTKVDVACDLKLCPSPEALRDRLRQLHPVATDPPLTGVESRAIFNDGTSGPGFVVAYIPESSLKPLRAEHMEGKPYMLRIGDTFKNPSPAILRNLFFPRSSAQLSVAVQPRWTGIERRPGMAVQDIEIQYLVTIHNGGVVSAKDIFFIVDMSPYVLEVETPYGATKVETEAGIGIEYTRFLHPSSKIQICAIRHRVGVGTRTSTGEDLLVPRSTNFAATFHLFAADMQPVKLRAVVSDWDIDRKELKWAKPIIGEA